MRNEFSENPKVSQQEIASPKTDDCLPKKRTLRYTQKITYTATLTAAALIIKATVQFVFSFLPFTRPTLTYIPWIIAGIILDPPFAAAVGLFSDLLGMITAGSGGAINPIMSLSCALFPCFVSIAVRALPVKRLSVKVLLGVCFSAATCTLGLSTLGLYLWSGLYQNNVAYIKPFDLLLLSRLPQLGFIALCAAVSLALIPLLDRLKLLPDMENRQK